MAVDALLHASADTAMPAGPWKKFLTTFSRDLLKDGDLRDHLPAEAVASKWLGFEPAAEEQIAALEKKLGTKLPPSYRTFLAATNGWRDTGPFIARLLPCAEVDWLRARHEDDVIAPWCEGAAGAEVSAEEHLVYGEGQNPSVLRSEYLRDALQISDYGDGVYLLNPKVVTAKGEWEAWFFAPWLPGAQRYPSFRELLEAEHENWVKGLKDKPKPAKKGTSQPAGKGKPKKITTKERREIQEIALRGDADAALARYRDLLERGDDASAASLAEIHAFQGRWPEVIPYAGRFLANPNAAMIGNVFFEMVRLLARAGRETGSWDEVRRVVAAARDADAVRAYEPHHEYQRQNNARIFNNLLAYADRKGGPPHELVNHPDARVGAVGSDEENERQYRESLKNAPGYVKKDPAVLAQHCFSLAAGLDRKDEMLRLYAEAGPSMALRWDNAVNVARVHAERGESDRAWGVLQQALPHWHPLALSQVAPVELLVDERLANVMGVERCREVLQTRRGGV